MAAKILVVDDEPHFERLILQRFRKKIREKVYEFAFAGNGVEALEVLARDKDIQIVLSDINMPQMDGISLVRELNASYPMLRTVMVSAYGDMENIRKAMNMGAYDFVTKPIDFEDLATTINKTLEQVEIMERATMAKELSAQNAQLQEMDQLKSRFFTNISHEFRTPLTIIRGMAGQILEDPGKWGEKGGKMILRNSNSLLNLVNQILDLRKMESGKLSLQMVQGDVINYLSYIFESFQSLAESKDVRLHFLTEEKELIMDYDPDKLLRIVSNLLSNAIKFTPVGGNVNLKVKGEEVKSEADPSPLTPHPSLIIQVKDTGIGIPAEKLPHIFNRFYQVDDSTTRKGEGTGIGLALTQELVKLMGGDIAVESEPGAGSVFSVKLPVSRSAEYAEAAGENNRDEDLYIQYMPVLELPGLAADEQLPTLLIVEDNADVVQYLITCLEDQYQITIAQNGQQGIDMAIEQVPDLIVSDVMMPEKSGFELCGTLKADERTSHIPIVLLTARADVESRISGLERGADDYLGKPFNREELLARLKNLLALREKLQERYGSLADIRPSSDKAVRQEDEFIQKIRNSIEENIDDEGFGIAELCRAIGLSRTQLHHKIKALTGRSTSHYIRSVRLQRARQLLADTTLNISEIAYEVGFRDPKYFSRTYREEYGQNPRKDRG